MDCSAVQEADGPVLMAAGGGREEGSAGLEIGFQYFESMLG